MHKEEKVWLMRKEQEIYKDNWTRKYIFLTN